MNLNQLTLSSSLIQTNFVILTLYLHQIFHKYLQMFQLCCPFQQPIKGNENVIADLSQATPKVPVGFKMNPICPLLKDASYAF